jgi:hypothetical protein
MNLKNKKVFKNYGHKKNQTCAFFTTELDCINKDLIILQI